ncbi:hypothetical protein [Solidesulfovibrio sp.]
MDTRDDPNLFLPGGQGLIRFPDQDNWRLSGDEKRADTLRGAALQLKAGLDQGNVNALNQCSAVRRYDDGTVIEVRKNYNFYDLSIYCPQVERSKPVETPNAMPQLEPGQFFWLPGCVARYGFAQGKELFNEIPIRIGGGVDTSNMGIGLVFLTTREAGLPAPGTSPDGSISRKYRVCRLDGADPESGLGGAIALLSGWHIPTVGPFTLSCVVKLRQEIENDYSFTEKTQESGNGFTIWNPIKPRLLRSSDGVNWATECPASLAPLVGYKIPTRFSSHWARLTLPWPDYNINFVTRSVEWIGYHEIRSVCDGEPLLVSDYDAASPYWDKVEVGDIKTIEGEYSEFSEKNTDFNNIAPYCSYCKFKVECRYLFSIGTRAKSFFDDGSHCFATVEGSSFIVEEFTVSGKFSCSVGDNIDIPNGGGRKGTVESFVYNYNGDIIVSTDLVLTTYTIFKLKDYLYKKYLIESVPSVSFGSQPFPVCHPQGYMIGMNIMGLCWYNGNKIVAGKICNFEEDYLFEPIVSDQLSVGIWHHVVMTYDASGKTSLYITEIEGNETSILSGFQPTSVFINTDGHGGFVPVSIGADGWTSSPIDDSSFSNDYSSWVASSYMDIGLLRVYHRALSKNESKLLVKEAFGGVFVADDHESAQLMGAGLVPMMV